jgi:hypothetical protein
MRKNIGENNMFNQPITRLMLASQNVIQTIINDEVNQGQYQD